MNTEVVKVHDAYGYKNMLDNLNALKTSYPEFEIAPIGKSVLGRMIPAVRLGTGTRRLHYNGSIHANEWITTLLLMVFIENYLQANRQKSRLEDIDISACFSRNSLWIVPMVNPDGVELVQNGFSAENPFYRDVLQANLSSTNFRSWKANIRGVDLNDQFPANWEREYRRRKITMPAPSDYPGPSPLSEPEAQALANFTEEMDFQLIMAFHTQGEQIYWGYEDCEPAESSVIIERLARASGYRPIRNAPSDAGYKDWFIAKWRRPGFIVECGLGQNPLPVSQFRSIWPQALRIMLTGLTE